MGIMVMMMKLVYFQLFKNFIVMSSLFHLISYYNIANLG